MAYMKKMQKPGEVVTEPPPPGPGDEPPPPPDPGPVLLLMNVDGGLNGQCWRAGQTVVMDSEAAGFYLAKGHGMRAK